MKTITRTGDALIWLDEMLVTATPRTKVSTYVLQVYVMASEYGAYKRECRSLPQEMWEHIVGQLVKATKLGPYDVTMSVPLAAFITELMADLATRGESGSVSREQMVMMMISALGWAEQFKLVEDKGGAVITSSAAFESAHDVQFRVPVSPAVMLDLHYTILPTE